MKKKQAVEKNELIRVVREFINDNFLFENDGELEEETSFLESGIIDSTGILELIAFLEKEYGISVDDEEIVPENLDSLKSLVNFLQGKLAA